MGDGIRGEMLSIIRSAINNISSPGLDYNEQQKKRENEPNLNGDSHDQQYNDTFDKLNFQLLTFHSQTLTGEARNSTASLNEALHKQDTASLEYLLNNKDPWLDNQAVRYATQTAEDSKRLTEDSRKSERQELVERDSNSSMDEINNVQSLMNILGFEGEINQGFLNEMQGMGGEIRSGSVDTERSFNPLNVIATDKDGFTISSLNSFFKTKDIEGADLQSYAKGLGQYNWATMSRAMDDVLIKGFKDQGLSDAEILKKTSTQIAQAAKLFEGTRFENNSQAMTFMLAHLALDQDALDKSGLSQEQISELSKGDNTVVFGEALKYKPDLLDNKDIFNNLKDAIAKESQDRKLDHFNQEVKAGSLANIESDMRSLLSGKYADDLAKIQESYQNNLGKSFSVDGALKEMGLTSKSDFMKVNNADAVAQTVLNWGSLNHDYELNQKSNLTDENRLLSQGTQISVRSTPKGSADHNGAFNEKNIGRDKASTMGQNRDQLAQFVFPYIGDDKMKNFFDKISDTGLEVSNLDISHHGSSQGTHGGAGGVGSGDKALFQSIEKAMAAGGEVVYNSCSCGAGSDKGSSSNVVGATLKSMVENKGIKVHAATVSTIGYTEHTGFDVGTGQFFMTPVKLDGATGGITLQAPDPEDKAFDRGLKENHHANYINADRKNENFASNKDKEKEEEFAFS